MAELENGAAEAVTETAPASVETVTTEVTHEAPQTFEEKIHGTMEEAWNRLNPPREANGKFKTDKPTEAAPVEAAPEGTETTDQSRQEEQGTAAPSTTAPNAWSAEEKALWAKVPPEAQAVIARRETEAHRAITQMGERIKAYEPVGQVIDQHRGTFQKLGISEADGVAALLNADARLRQNPAEGIKWLADSFGVDLRQIVTGEKSEGSELTRELAQLRQEVRQLRSNQTAREHSETESRKHSLAQVINDFAEKPEIKPYFADLESEIMAQIPGVKDSEPHLPPDKILEKAFEKAKWAHPTVRQRILDDQRKADEDKRKAEQAKQVAEAKKQVALNAKSSRGASPIKGSWEDTMRARADELMPNG